MTAQSGGTDEKLQEMLTKIRSLVNQLKELPELNDSALPILGRLNALYSSYDPLDERVKMTEALTDAGGQEILMKLLRAASPDGVSLSDEVLRRVEFALIVMVNYSEGFTAKEQQVQYGAVKYMVNLLKHVGSKSSQRADTRNIRRFAITILTNMSTISVFRATLRQARVMEITADYMNARDNPCKIAALEILCHIANVDEAEITCNDEESLEALIRLLNKHAYKGWVTLENSLFTVTGLTQTLTLLAVGCTSRKKIIMAAPVPLTADEDEDEKFQMHPINLDKAIKEVILEVREGLGIKDETEEAESPKAPLLEPTRIQSKDTEAESPKPPLLEPLPSNDTGGRLKKIKRTLSKAYQKLLGSCCRGHRGSD